MAATFRNRDTNTDLQISRFLDKNFYPQYTENRVRYTDYDNQMSGIDVKFDYNGLKGILVDEKAVATYVNKFLPTFALEINFLSGEQLIPGWFYDRDKVTQYYLMSWVWATKDKYYSAEDITELYTLLVSRQKITEMLASYGMTKEIAEDTAKYLRANNISSQYQKDLSSRPFYFMYSPGLVEAPVNLIVRREKLAELATAVFTIKPIN